MFSFKLSNVDSFNTLAIGYNGYHMYLHGFQFDEGELRVLIEQGYSQQRLAVHFGTHRSNVARVLRRLKLTTHVKLPQHDPVWAKKHSEKIKAYFRNNPDKHPWKKHTKFISKPCEHLKQLLRERGISFVPEFTPLTNRLFSVDIAFPDRLVALEVNGNHHYDKSGQLKPYYQARHDLLVSHGWKVYEIHYSCCFKAEKILPIVEAAILSPVKLEFDYLTYVPRKKSGNGGKKSGNGRRSGTRKKVQCICGGEKYVHAKTCSKCYNIDRHSHLPTKEVLADLIWRMPTTHIAKQFSVSDKAVDKWCKYYSLAKPPRGYWRRVQCKLSN